MARAVKKEKPSGAKELREDIRQKHFRRVYLLYGEEEYLVRQYRQELIKAVCGEEDSMNLNIHRDDHLDWSTIQDEILSMPFFAQYRMVVLDDTKLFRSGRKTDSGAKEEAEEAGDAIGDMSDSAEERNGSDDAGLSAAIASFLPRIPETTVVLFTERPDEKKPGGQKGKSSVDRRGKLFKSVAKCGLAAEFSTPDEQELRKWVLGKLGAEKIRITQETLNVFFSMTGTDMSHIHTETQKLISFAGPGGVVRTEDVAALTSEILEGKIFRMLDLISQHDRKGALELYQDLLLLKEPPGKILSLLTRQFDQLLLAASILEDGGSVIRVMETLGVQKWQADKIVRQARGFSCPMLREALAECARIQAKAQSGHIDMRLGLELLILRFSRAGRQTDQR